MTSLSDFGLYATPIKSVLGLSLAFLVVFAGLLAVFWILKGIALLSLSEKSENENQRWYGFVPFFKDVALGGLADKHFSRFSKRITLFSNLLGITSVLSAVFFIASWIMAAVGTVDIIFTAEELALSGETMAHADFKPIINAISVGAVGIFIAIINKIISLVALWKVYSVFCERTAVLFTVLSVICYPLSNIFLFLIRNNEPKYQLRDTAENFFTTI